MDLVSEFRIDSDTGILQAVGGPEVRFYPSVQFDPEGTSIQLGLFLLDYGTAFLQGQFFDAVRGDNNSIAGGMPWDVPDDEPFFGVPKRSGVFVLGAAYEYGGPDGPGDVLIVAIPEDEDYNIVTVYADPSEGVPTEGSVYGTGDVFTRQKGSPGVVGSWLSPPEDVRPLAVGTYFDETGPATYLLGLYRDGPEIRLVRSRLDPSGEGIDLESATGTELLSDFSAPAPEYDGEVSVGRLAVRDLASAGDATRIAVSLPESGGGYAVFLGRVKGSGFEYTRVEGVSNAVIEVLANGLLVVDTGTGYEVVNASGELVWRLRSPSVFYAGEREVGGERYLYFTSGYWAGNDEGEYRITRVHRVPTPEP